MMPDINIGQNLAQGFQLGANIRQMRQQQAMADKALQEQEVYKAMLAEHFANPTYESASKLMMRFPQQREAIKESWEITDKATRQQDFTKGMQAFQAISNNNIPAAESLLDEYIISSENSGKDATQYKVMKEQLKTDPKGVAAQLSWYLSSAEPDKFNKISEEIRKQGLAPLELEKMQAEVSIKGEEAKAAPFKTQEAKSSADKAAVAAKFAESDAALDLQQKGWNIQKLQNDIALSKQNTAIAAMNAQTARMGNSLKAQENQLKLQDLISKRDETVRTKAAEIESARSSMDNMLNTAERVLKTPKSVVNSAAGAVVSKIPTLRNETSDFEGLLETLSSQAFMAQIPNLKGLGALSNAEGEKLQAALQNFSLKQSPERLLTNVKEAQRLILKARKNVSDKYGVPDTAPDTPAATQGVVSSSGAEMQPLQNAAMQELARRRALKGK